MPHVPGLRSPYAQVGGLVYFGRMLDKIRKHARGELREDFHEMLGQGFESHVPMDKLGVRGYAEVLRHYREIMAIRRRLAERFLAERPAVFIGVDSSDFNLDLERQLKDAGIPAIQYVSPSIWAWRGWRTRRIVRSVSHILALFEKDVNFHPIRDFTPISP